MSTNVWCSSEQKDKQHSDESCEMVGGEGGDFNFPCVCYQSSLIVAARCRYVTLLWLALRRRLGQQSAVRLSVYILGDATCRTSRCRAGWSGKRPATAAAAGAV